MAKYIGKSLKQTLKMKPICCPNSGQSRRKKPHRRLVVVARGEAHPCGHLASADSWRVSVPPSAPEQAVFSPLLPEVLMSTALLGGKAKARLAARFQDLKLLALVSVCT